MKEVVNREKGRGDKVGERGGVSVHLAKVADKMNLTKNVAKSHERY